jgi:hypothetical protein
VIVSPLLNAGSVRSKANACSATLTKSIVFQLINLELARNITVLSLLPAITAKWFAKVTVFP